MAMHGCEGSVSGLCYAVDLVPAWTQAVVPEPGTLAPFLFCDPSSPKPPAFPGQYIKCIFSWVFVLPTPFWPSQPVNFSMPTARKCQRVTSE